MKTLDFIKMQALGNDFVVLDARKAPLNLENSQIRNICDRRLGVGCDQLIVIENSSAADAFMRIYNADGSEAGACGNASRCIAHIVLTDSKKDRITLETISGILECSFAGDGKNITVNMGAAKLEWQQIPLSEERDTLHLDLKAGGFSDPVAVNMGNPHAVFFVDDVESQPIEKYGAQLENDPLFPERANIEFAQILDRANIRMRVWERGAGITQACGSGACATGVAAIRRNLTDRKVTIHMDGGALGIEWLENGQVLMTGGYEYAFKGQYFL